MSLLPVRKTTTPDPGGTGNITGDPALVGAWHLSPDSPCLGAGSADGATRPRESIVTVLDGIRNRVGAACQVDYLKGCDTVDPGDEDIAAAAALAREADVAIVVVGDDTTLNGERRDRADLDLSGAASSNAAAMSSPSAAARIADSVPARRPRSCPPPWTRTTGSAMLSPG